MARDAATREVMAAAVRETLAVARASGIALDEDEVSSAVWRTADAMSTQYSSTAQDILRGKPTEIDMLNGYVASAARRSASTRRSIARCTRSSGCAKRATISQEPDGTQHPCSPIGTRRGMRSTHAGSPPTSAARRTATSVVSSLKT